MHTTHDHMTKEPKLWLIHNSDFSGEVEVHWTIKGSEKDFSYVWRVPMGEDLLTGNIIGTQIEDNTCAPVPAWVIARAVATALHHHLTMKIVSFVEGL